MILYPLDDKNIWTGEVLNKDHYSGKVITETPPELTGSQVALRTRNGWTVLNSYPIAKPEIKVPISITRRQCKQQLLLLGLLDQVQPMLDAIPDPTEKAMMQIYWDDSQEFERNHPQLIAMAQGLGLTDEQIDQAFIAAGSL